MQYAAPIGPIYRGQTWVETIPVDDGETGEPVNLSGSTFWLELFHPSEKSAVLTIRSEDGRITLPPTIGVVSWSVTADETAGLDAGVHQARLWIRRAGETWLLSKFKLTVF